VESVGPSCAEIEGLTVSPRILPDHLDEGGNRGSPIRRTDSPSKKKGMGTLICNSIKDFLEWTASVCLSILAYIFPQLTKCDIVPFRKEKPTPGC